MEFHYDVVPEKEIAARLVALPGWRYKDKALEKVKTLASFQGALDYVNEIGACAEAHDHHPEITIKYKKVVVRYWAHRTGGVTENDFLMAGRVEEIAKRHAGETG